MPAAARAVSEWLAFWPSPDLCCTRPATHTRGPSWVLCGSSVLGAWAALVSRPRMPSRQARARGGSVVAGAARVARFSSSGQRVEHGHAKALHGAQRQLSRDHVFAETLRGEVLGPLPGGRGVVRMPMASSRWSQSPWAVAEMGVSRKRRRSSAIRASSAGVRLLPCCVARAGQARACSVADRRGDERDLVQRPLAAAQPDDAARRGPRSRAGRPCRPGSPLPPRRRGRPARRPGDAGLHGDSGEAVDDEPQRLAGSAWANSAIQPLAWGQARCSTWPRAGTSQSSGPTSSSIRTSGCRRMRCGPVWDGGPGGFWGEAQEEPFAAGHVGAGRRQESSDDIGAVDCDGDLWRSRAFRAGQPAGDEAGLRRSIAPETWGAEPRATRRTSR